MRRMKTLISILTLFLLSFTGWACDGTSVTVLNFSDNGDGTFTLDLNVCFEPYDFMGYTDQVMLEVDAGTILSFSPSNIIFSDGTDFIGSQLNSTTVQWAVPGFDWVGSGEPDQCYNVSLVINGDPLGYSANVGPNCIHSGALPTPCSTPTTPTMTTSYNYCVGDVITDFSASGGVGNTISWYDENQTLLLHTGNTATAGNLNLSSASSGSTTFYVTQTDGDCESDFLEVTVAVTDQGNASFNSFGPFCEGDASITLNNQATVDLGGSWTINGIASTNFDPSSLGPGTFVVEYTVGTGTCSDTQNSSVTVNADSDASFSSFGPLCETDEAVTLDDQITGDLGGSWTINGNAATEFDPSVLGVGSYSVEYSVGTNCPDNTSITVNVSDCTSPYNCGTVDFTMSDYGPFDCTDEVVDLEAIDPPSLFVADEWVYPGFIVTVTPVGGASWDGLNTADILINGVTEYQIDPILLGFGAFDSFIIPINYAQPESFGFGVSGNNGDNFTFEIINAADNTVASSGTWVIGGTDVATVGLPIGTADFSGPGVSNNPDDGGKGFFDPSVAGPGTHTITYTWDNGSGCFGTATMDVVVNGPDATVTSFGPLCESESVVTLSNQEAGTTGGSWMVNGVTSANFDPSLLGTGTHTVEYTVGDPGCQDSESFDVDVTANYYASWSSPNYCESEPDVTLSDLVTGDTGGSWTLDGVAATTFSPSGLGQGNYTLEYSVGSGACADQLSQTVSVTAGADASFTTPGPYCESESSVNLNDFVTGATGGSWSGTGVNGTWFEPQSVGEGSYTVDYTVGTGTCQSTYSQTIDVVSAPDPTFIVQSACEGNSFELEHTGSVTPSTTFDWDFDGLNAYGQGTGVYDLGTPDDGIYNITLTVSDGGCSSQEFSQILEVYQQPTLNVAVADESCFGSCNGVVILTPVEGSFNSAPNYLWNTGLTVGTAANLCAGSYSVEVSDDNGCSNSYDFEVLSPEELVVSVSSQDVSCNGMNDGSVSVNVYGGTPAYSVLWSNGDTNQVLNQLTAGTYDVQVTDAYGCSHSEQVEVYEPLPVLNGETIKADPESLLIGMNTEVTVDGVFDSYQWYVNDSLLSTNDVLTQSFEEVGTYPVTLVVETQSCYDTLETEVEVEQLFSVFIPNAFSPQDDGVNEDFKPVVTLDNVLEYEFRIFNRWGELQFETSDLNQSWDGRSLSGDFCQMDVYVYQVVITAGANQQFSDTGHVTLLR